MSENTYSRTAGEFQPPPAMVRDISKWMLEVCSAHLWADIEPKLEVSRNPNLTQKYIDHNNTQRQSINLDHLAIGEAITIEVYTFRNHEIQTDNWGIKRKNVYNFIFGSGRNGAKISWKPDKLSYVFVGEHDSVATTSLIERLIGNSNYSIFTGCTNPQYNIVDLAMLAKELRKHAAKPKHYARTVTKDFPVDLTGWRYNQPDDLKPNEAGFATISVSIDFGGTKRSPNSLGHWIASDKELVLVPMIAELVSVPEYMEDMADMIKILAHELRHVGQTVLAAIRGSTELYGLPSKQIRNQEFNSYGLQLSPSGPLQKVHPLRDVEFYTRLSDEVVDFVNASRKIPTSALRDAIRTWVADTREEKFQYGPDRDKDIVVQRLFFHALKTKEPKKWAKAVAEFYKALEGRGIRIPSNMLTRIALQWITANPQHVLEDASPQD